MNCETNNPSYPRWKPSNHIERGGGLEAKLMLVESKIDTTCSHEKKSGVPSFP